MEKKMLKKTIALALSCICVFGAFCGCGKDADVQAGKGDNPTATVTGGTGDTAMLNITFPKKFIAKKMGSYQTDSSISSKGSSITYSNKEGKKGIVTADGTCDTGAKYTTLEGVQNRAFYVVSTMEIDEVNSKDIKNYMGVADVNGKMIVPEEYATVELLSDRYAYVSKITKEADSKETALVYSSPSSLMAKSITGEPMNVTGWYEGNWFVYDLRTGETVKGVAGTKPAKVTVCGEYITYMDDNGERHCVNARGEELPEGAVMLDDGSYIVEKDGAGKVYSTSDEKLFEYNTKDLKIKESAYHSSMKNKNEYEYFLGVENSSKYVIMDRTGKKIPAEFEYKPGNGTPKICGKYIYMWSGDGKIYDFDGNVIIDEKIESVKYDDFTKSAIELEKHDGTILILTNEGEIKEVGKKNDIKPTKDFVYISKADEKKAYSFAENTFSISPVGMGLCSWLVKTTSENGKCNIIDTLSGEIIVEGYENYAITQSGNKNYLHGYYRDNSGYIVDVYEVTGE